jgi:hypothetical protein
MTPASGLTSEAGVKAHRRDRGPDRNQSGECNVIVSVRERDGNSVLAASIRKARSVHSRFTREGMVARCDEVVSRDNSYERFEVERISREAAYSLDGARADVAAKHFRCAAARIHCDVAGSHFLWFPQESASRGQATRSSALKSGYPLGVRRRFTACRRGERATR